MSKKLVVLVHGWSVTHTDTYGGFPERLRAEAAAGGLDIDVRNIWIGEYISFHDEVRVSDLVQALDRAIEQSLGTELRRGARFACITHSTGGPIVRAWWHRYYLFGRRRRACPMSHLIMLAPANFGSALAQLGKSTLGRLKGLLEGIEPGVGVLNWLELGSGEAWALNEEWIRAPSTIDGDGAVFPFVLTGQTIDRAFYDHLNSYTGELGSDGVVRAAAANLNAAYLRLEQNPVTVQRGSPSAEQALTQTELVRSQPTAFALVKGAAHSGSDIGILKSVSSGRRPHPTIPLVLDCLGVETGRAYRALARRFEAHNDQVFRSERIEVQDRPWPMGPRFFVHDRCSMTIFRLRDDEGHPVADFRLVLTAEDNDPDKLPPGFLVDRQKNRLSRNTLSFYFNHDALVGAPPAVKTIGGKRRTVRERMFGIGRLGLSVTPEPVAGFAHYVAATLNAQARLVSSVMRAHQTTLVDLVVKRVVRDSAFRLVNLEAGSFPRSFKKREPDELV